MKVKEYQGFTVTQAGHSWYWWNNSMKGVKGPFMTEPDAVMAAMLTTRDDGYILIDDEGNVLGYQ